ncbi:MAG: hypothetical protein ACK528_11770, partial [Alphaproteobacteria bacterium]
MLIEFHETDQFFGPMEGEDCAAASVGFFAIGKSTFNSGGFVSKWEWDFPPRQQLRQTQRILRRLLGNAHESEAFWLCFNASNGSCVSIQ